MASCRGYNGETRATHIKDLMKKKNKPLYVELNDKTHKEIKELCKALDLPKTKVVTQAVRVLHSQLCKKS